MKLAIRIFALSVVVAGAAAAATTPEGRSAIPSHQSATDRPCQAQDADPTWVAPSTPGRRRQVIGQGVIPESTGDYYPFCTLSGGSFRAILRKFLEW